jgi:hypothetical protein
MVNHMDELKVSQCTPRLREKDKKMGAHPMIVDFTPGYMQRGMHLFPKQGDWAPWRNTQNYTLDKQTICNAPIEDGVLDFSNPPVSSTAELIDAKQSPAVKTAA